MATVMSPLPSISRRQQEICRPARARVVLAQGRRRLGHQILALETEADAQI